MNYLQIGGKENKTAKGIKESAMRKYIGYVAYKYVLLNEEFTRATMNLIRSYHHLQQYKSKDCLIFLR